MLEFDESTISMTGSNSSKVDATKSPALAKPIARPTVNVVATAMIGLLIVGFGSWRYFDSTPAVDDSDSIADLEGFDSAPPFHSSQATEPTSTVRPAETSPLAAPGKDQVDANDSVERNPVFTKAPIVTADVWLTGTIEEAEPTDRTASPKRLSGGSNETLILR